MNGKSQMQKTCSEQAEFTNYNGSSLTAMPINEQVDECKFTLSTGSIIFESDST